MPQKLRITCGGVALEVETLDTPTAAAVLAATPFSARARASSDLTRSFDGPERLIRAGAARGAMWVIGQAPPKSSLGSR